MLGGLLLVRSLHLPIRLSAGGCGLSGLGSLSLQLGCSTLQLRGAPLQIPHGPLKLVLHDDGPAQQFLVAQILRPVYPNVDPAALPADLDLSSPDHPVEGREGYLRLFRRLRSRDPPDRFIHRCLLPTG